MSPTYQKREFQPIGKNGLLFSRRFLNHFSAAIISVGGDVVATMKFS
jgi:hypothetical protein